MTEKTNILQREDNAKIKRVELSVYTKMGPMDSVVPVKELIRTAARWGWDAVAITDHGGVQAFPDAMNVVDDDKLNIKVVYGMEGALVGDYHNPIGTHITLLAKNMDGLHNLYRLVSLSHLFFGHRLVCRSDLYSNRYAPQIPRFILQEHREGLLLGSSGANGELIRAIVSRQYGDEELITLARFYDYLEIQPIENYTPLLRSKEFTHIHTEEDLRDINRKIAALAKKLDKLLVATGDVHFIHQEDAICLEVLRANNGSDETIPQPSLFLHTTEEMLNEFDYLGEEIAYEAVVTNSRRIADMVERIKPFPNDNLYAPELPDADETIKRLSYQRAHELYGEKLPEIVQARLDQELTPIIKRGFSSLYLIPHKIVEKSNKDGYTVGARGSVGSSFVATMTGITEVNPLPPHWRCPKCHYSEFITDGSFNSGFDLPDKVCPNCGEALIKDGHDIPFSVFLGYDGEKVPDIDLNVAGGYHSELHRYIERLFGQDRVYVAGTMETLREKEVQDYIREYFNRKRETPSDSLIERIRNRCVGVKKTTGAHPYGFMIVPEDMDIHFFTPVQHPEDRLELSDVVTTHFDYHAISSCLVKFDILGHDIPTLIKLLEDYTHCGHRTIPFDDPKTFSLFRSTEALGVSPEELGATTGTLGIPEFQSPFARRMLEETKPTCFSDLVKISGLCHGTAIWKGNMQDLIRDGVCTLHDAISVRDDIMMYLIYKGIDPLLSFKTMESVRKGKGIKPDVVEKLRAGGVPEWYIEACQKVKYLFPRAHTTTYVMMAFRLAYYKAHYPLAFYAAFFSTCTEAMDVDVIVAGKEAVKKSLSDLKAQYADLEEDPYNLSFERYEELEAVRDRAFVLQVALEMLLRGFTVKPVDPERSDAEKFIILDNSLLPPCSVLRKSNHDA